jgi:PmbA protein
VARGTTFLKDAMDTEVFAPGLNVIEEPHRQRGLRSKPCDAEGLPNHKRALIDNGRLTSWILDLRSARQLNLTPTGHAARSTGGPPSPSTTNVFLAAGAETPEALMADITEGFYITDLVGQGVNMVTGDYSRGAVGFWIEKGKTAYPVSEVTIAGNLPQMFKAIRPANDLELLYGIDAPTVRIDGMTVAGT